MTLPSHVAMPVSVAYSMCKCSAETLVRIRPEALETHPFCVPIVIFVKLRISLTRHHLSRRYRSHDCESSGSAVWEQHSHSFDLWNGRLNPRIGRHPAASPTHSPSHHLNTNSPLPIDTVTLKLLEHRHPSYITSYLPAVLSKGIIATVV